MNWEVRIMQSRISCFNPTLLRKNLTRFWPLWGLASFVGVLFPLALLLDFIRRGPRAVPSAPWWCGATCTAPGA